MQYEELARNQVYFKEHLVCYCMDVLGVDLELAVEQPGRKGQQLLSLTF
jgi:hypothetical protein